MGDDLRDQSFELPLWYALLIMALAAPLALLLIGFAWWGG